MLPQKVFLFFLTFLLAVTILVTDLYLPSLPAMVIDFNTTEANIQKTISYSFLGICLSSLVTGSLADRFTKKAVFRITIIVFIVSGILSPLAFSIEVLWVLRFIQGWAVGALPVIIIALVADLYEGKKLNQVMSLLGVVITTSLAFSPIIGGWIGNHWGWRGCFWVTSVLGIILSFLLWNSFPLSHSSKASLSFTHLRAQLGVFWQEKAFLYICLFHGIIFAASLNFRSTLSHYCSDILNMGPLQFGSFLSAATAISAITGLGINYLLNYFHSRTLLEAGFVIYVLSSFILMGVCVFYPYHVTGLFLVMALNNVAVALCFSTTLSMALDPLKSSKGLASSVLISFRSFLAGFFIYGGGVVYNKNLWSLALPFVISIAILLSFYVYKRPLFIKSSR